MWRLLHFYMSQCCRVEQTHQGSFEALSLDFGLSTTLELQRPGWLCTALVFFPSPFALWPESSKSSTRSSFGCSLNSFVASCGCREQICLRRFSARHRSRTAGRKGWEEEEEVARERTHIFLQPLSPWVTIRSTSSSPLFSVFLPGFNNPEFPTCPRSLYCRTYSCEFHLVPFSLPMFCLFCMFVQYPALTGCLWGTCAMCFSWFEFEIVSECWARKGWPSSPAW